MVLGELELIFRLIHVGRMSAAGAMIPEKNKNGACRDSHPFERLA